jgi:DNA polymerase V
MIGAGIYPEDLLVVDRSIEVENNDIVVAIYDGELILKRFRELDGEVWLCAENPEYPDLLVKKELDFHVWGVVTYVIHKL